MADKSRELPSTTLVIFGVSGDLAHRYLLPALAEICQNSDFRARLKILGLSRRLISASAVLTDNTAGLKSQLQTLQIDYDRPEQYQKLKDKLGELDSEQVIFYFAVPPEAVPPIVSNLGSAGLNSARYRLLMEKPFGEDLASAMELISQTDKCFKEDQVYRIDHYLAKEAAQNIAIFLGSNGIFRHVWNNQFISDIEIMVSESIGIEGRSGFYEKTGALRDIIQSHSLQLTALTLMEPCPSDFDFSELPGRRLTALKQLSISADKTEGAVRGQYAGYKEEVGNPDSSAETFAAVQFESSDSRWQGVPILLVTGKKLDHRLTQIKVNFNQDKNSEPNTLILRIQPREGIELDLWVKQPGYDRKLEKKTLSFSYEQNFAGRLPNAYEQILVDAMRGSHSLFASSGEVLESWRILQPLLGRWQTYPLKIYEPGTSANIIIQNT